MLELIRELWSSACIDAPKRPSCQVLDGRFVFTVTGNRDNWAELCKLSGVPSNAAQVVEGDVLIVAWPSLADQWFGADGPLAKAKANYRPRRQQIQMARMVQRGIEMNDAALIEAGTGTGKGFAYLVPALAMKKRVIVSTSNKALQAQLIDKDLPFLAEFFPGLTVALAQGKSNYACKMKTNALTARHSAQVDQWLQETQSGNTEEITFELTPKERAAIVADDECPGQKTCQYGATCFYYAAKAARAKADVIVTNHALLALNLAFPAAELLPHVPVVIVDEAHKLPEYARSMLGNEITDSKIRSTVDRAEAYDPASPVDRLAAGFFSDVSIRIGRATDNLITIEKDDTIDGGVKLAAELFALADTIWEPDVMPSDSEQRRLQREADRIRRVADKVIAFSLPPADGRTRWIEVNRSNGGLKMMEAPFDVAPFLKNLVGYEVTAKVTDRTQCARCGRTLTAQVVNVLEGRPYGPDCIRYVDVFGDADQVDLAEWLDTGTEPEIKPAGKHATIFCSATLAAPTMDPFMRDCGIMGGLQMIAESPFDYANNVWLYVPTGASPAPSAKEHKEYVVSEIERLVDFAQGSAFLLFTSNAMLRDVSQILTPFFRSKGFPVYIQGDGLGKLEIARRFAADGNAVLFGTKSFFEGVSIEGDALRLVTIDKMPFAAPHPITTAQEAALVDYAKTKLGLVGDKATWYPFDALRVPNMLMDLKQGFGRLIRTVNDYGTVAIFDPRLRTTHYGRNTVLPALPVPANRITHNLYTIADFYASRRPTKDNLVVAAPPKLQAVPATDFTLIEEMAF